MKNIKYNCKLKKLPAGSLQELFVAVGWSDGAETGKMKEQFNLPFINSTFVISAWDEQKLVGVIRVLSDKIIRSVIYDFAVLPEYQDLGIGSTLLRKCLQKYPDTAWVVETTENNISYYKKFEFEESTYITLRIKSKWEK
jgi:ribosomal protein S18 acetylase RimI-like enzyme